jgi:archaellum component FlaF (FlaF/FlaG flagellin family)
VDIDYETTKVIVIGFFVVIGVIYMAKVHNPNPKAGVSGCSEIFVGLFVFFGFLYVSTSNVIWGS